MPTERISFDVAQDALLIFINDSHSTKEAEMTDQLEQLFHGAKEYLYLDGTSVESGAVLANIIAGERNDYRISLPASNRLVVCFWLDVDQMTEAWFARYQKIAEEIQRLLPVQGHGQHCYITCLTYEVGAPLSEKTPVQVLQKFADPGLLFSHRQYLLYKPMLESLDRQKAAMAQLLHMWTRKDYQKILDPSDLLDMKSLCIVSSADYQEAEAERCQKKIEALKDWLEQETDPDLENLLRTAMTEAGRQSAKLEKAVEYFDEELSYLYPVRITDYRKPLFGKAERLVDSGNGSMLEKRKQDYLNEMKQQLLQTAGFDDIKEQIQQLHYPDLEKLRQAFERKGLRGEFLQRMKKPGKIMENNVEAFLEEWYERLEKAICSVLPDEQKERAKRQVEINRQKERLKEAGKYKNLADCLARISGQVPFSTPSEVLPKGNNRFMLIAGACNTNWLINGFQAEGVSQVYSYPNIAPSEVMMMREAPLIELTDERAAEDLSWILQ